MTDNAELKNLRDTFETLNNTYIQLKVFDSNMDRPNSIPSMDKETFKQTIICLRDYFVTIHDNLETISAGFFGWKIDHNGPYCINNGNALVAVIDKILNKLINKTFDFGKAPIVLCENDFGDVYEVTTLSQYEQMIGTLKNFVCTRKGDKVEIAFIPKMDSNARMWRIKGLNSLTLDEYLDMIFDFYKDYKK